jgi:hypothetical protein
MAFLCIEPAAGLFGSLPLFVKKIEENLLWPTWSTAAPAATQIRETAATYSECGAPQALVGRIPSAGPASLLLRPSSYGQIPWFRQRWALICVFLAFAPAAAVLAWELYHVARGTVKTLSNSVKIIVTCIAVFLLVAAGLGKESLQGTAGLVFIGMAVALSLRR